MFTMLSRLKLVLLVVFVLFAQSAFAKESARLPFPEAIKDSLPWFAVFELSDGNNPFTRNHLQAIAQKNQRHISLLVLDDFYLGMSIANHATDI